MKIKRTHRILITVLVLALLCTLVLSACSSKESKYEGTYVGSKSATLILRSGGKCSYVQTNWSKAEDGTWSIEDDVLTVSGVERLGYDIYARLEGDSAALLFEADSSRWNDELFVKSN